MTQASQPRPQPLRRRDVPAIDKRELASADDFTSAITKRWQDSVLAIIDVGKLLLGAKAALPHGEFGSMVESDKVPFGTSTARRLMVIAEHSILSKRAHVHVLPPSWRTVYELTRAPDEAITLWLTDGTIHPEMERKDVVALLKSLGDRKQEQTSHHPFTGDRFHYTKLSASVPAPSSAC